jgi:hypothetical protein
MWVSVVKETVMLIPQGMFRVLEYDATYTVTPTSKFSHDSDSVFAVVEMLVENDQQEQIDFPFVVLNTDSGDGAENSRSVEPVVVNGSREVELKTDQVDEDQFAEVMVQRAQAAGVTDPAQLERVRNWGRTALARAERTRVGRTRIKPGERRRIVLQQRIRIRPDAQGRYVFETIAPSPIATLATGGRVSLVVLLPWQDEDIRPVVVEKTENYEVEQGQVKLRPWIAWHWRNDPVFRLVYQYQ